MESSFHKILKINQTNLFHVNDFFEVFCQYENVVGVILWELDSTQEHIMLVAHSFENDYPIHTLSVSNSVTGEVIKPNTSFYVKDIPNCYLVFKDTQFWDDCNIK